MGLFKTLASFLQGVSPTKALLTFALLFVTLCVWIYLFNKRPAKLYKDFPLVSGGKPELGILANWILNGEKIIEDGFQKYDEPFQVQASNGPMIMLQNRFATEVKGEADISFNKSFCIDYPFLPGFDAFKHGAAHEALITDIVMRLTQAWPVITNRITRAMTGKISETFGEDFSEWKELPLRDSMHPIVVRSMSPLFFANPELNSDQGLLDAAANYPTWARMASLTLHALPPILRPLVHTILPASKALKKDYYYVEDKLVRPELRRRADEALKAQAKGEKPPQYHDGLEFMTHLGHDQKIDVNHTAWTFALTFAAVHTPADAIGHALLDLVERPELIPAIRQEIIETVGKEGWRKSVYYKMKIMDSLLKESARHNPTEKVTMHRYVINPIRLSNGSVLPAGSRFMVQDRLMDPTVYAEPHKFDMYRFHKARDTDDVEQSNSWQHATVSTYHMVFGYGHYACPGRFIASNVLKMALTQLIMKYDWEIVDKENIKRSYDFETFQVVQPELKVRFKRRQEECCVDADV